jgi:tyrosine-protein kinase Etk/Wzc
LEKQQYLKILDNEVEILKSRTLMETVVADLQLNITYFAKGKIKTTELFEKSPIVLRFLTPPVVKNRTSPVIYSLDISKTNKFTLSCEGANWQQAWGDTLILPEGKAILTQTKNPKPLENTVGLYMYRQPISR